MIQSYYFESLDVRRAADRRRRIGVRIAQSIVLLAVAAFILAINSGYNNSIGDLLWPLRIMGVIGAE